MNKSDKIALTATAIADVIISAVCLLAIFSCTSNPSDVGPAAILLFTSGIIFGMILAIFMVCYK